MFDYNKLNDFDKLLNKMIEQGVTPGMNVALLAGNEKWMKSYGNRQIIPTTQAATLDTIWDLASCSKVLVTVTCIMKLKEKGLLDLKMPMATYLPQLCDKKTTVLQCLTHTSGFPADIVGYKQMSQEEMIEAAYNIQIEEEWKDKVHYSDVNYILLGLLIAELKGSLAKYSQEVMFNPLNMTNTGYNPEIGKEYLCAAYEDQPSRGGVVKGKVHDGKAFKLGGVSGHAGVFSTIEDVSHFVCMMIHHGVYENHQFFSEETMELFKTCLTIGKNESRSLGWVLSDSNYALGHQFSEHTLYHTGFSGPSILIDLDRQFGCIVLANRVHPSRDNKKILEARNEIHDAAYACIIKGE